MSYLVLARKHRPAKFDDVLGQEHITNILKKAITADRVAHAYLFCGPRGIGKTSCARILAKCLNCEKGPTLQPPADSQICREIDQGTSLDVLEIDGASNRGIDEIRTLRENVKFAPNYGRYKIYIVDEVHMLTTEAFNALLKTLEEPPEHVKFIFATTDVNKVPATIISRCQRFDFKRIPLNTIVELLADVCKKEKFKAEKEALTAIAKAAQGSLRDGLSILDQLSALSDKSIKAEDVFSMLGIVEIQLLFDLVKAVGEKNCAEAMKVLDHVINQGKDIKQLNKDLVEHFRNLMVIKVGGKALGRLIDYPVAIKEMYLTQTELFTLREILDAVDRFIEASEVSKVTESVRLPVELAIAKLTYQADADSAPSKAKPAVSSRLSPQQTRKVSPIDVLKSRKGQADFSPGEIVSDDDEDIPIDGELPVHVEETADVDLEFIKKIWNTLTYAVSREKMSVATYLQEGIPYDFKGNTLTVAFNTESAFHKESLESTDVQRLIEKIFSEKLKTQVLLKFILADDSVRELDEQDPSIKAALSTFQGKVVSKWHKE